MFTSTRFDLVIFYFLVGLLIDVAKECMQAATKPATSALSSTAAAVVVRSSWCHNRYQHDAVDTSVATIVHWLHECSMVHSPSATATAAKGKGFPLGKIFKPTILTLGNEVTTAVDVDDLVLVNATVTGVKRKKTKNKKDNNADDTDSADAVQAATATATTPLPQDDVFIDLRTGSTYMEADKYIELRESAPFMWQGKSPFWSPLMMQRFVLEPMREYLKFKSDQVGASSWVFLRCLG